MFANGFARRVVETKPSRVLLAGMGGGYDVFFAVPLLFELRALGVSAVFLASLNSFTRDVPKRPGRRVAGNECCVEVRFSTSQGEARAEDGFPANYFPEWFLSRWFFEAEHEDVPVFVFPITGTRKLSAALSSLLAELRVDVVVLVDGGVDSLVRGDEEALGTFHEDALSISACALLTAASSGAARELQFFLMCTAMGTEDVSDQCFLENVTALQRMGGFLGAACLDPSSPAAKKYVAAVCASVPENSTINAQVVSALSGTFGHHCPPSIRSRGVRDADVFLTPLMLLEWFFDLRKVIEFRWFVEEPSMLNATCLDDVSSAFQQGRIARGVIDPENLEYRGKRFQNPTWT